MGRGDDMTKTLIIDWDWTPPEEWQKIWRKHVENTLKALGYHVKEIIMKPSSRRKTPHYWIHIKEEVDDDTANMLQWLLLDDTTRVRINALRIKRGVKNFWNKCFDHVTYTAPIDEKCKKCRMRKVLLQMAEEEGLLTKGVEPSTTHG